QEGVERRHGGTEIPQRLGPELHQVAVHAERLVALQAVVGGRRGRGHGRTPPGTRPGDPRHVPAPVPTPPVDVPWPPMNLVAEWITMSAPHSIGRHRYGVANVLSTTRGSSCSGPTAAHVPT